MSTLRAFNKGQTSVSSVYNTNVPTNAKLTTQSTGTGTFFTAIQTDDSQAATISEIKSGSGLLTEFTNRANTEGFKIKCFDNADSAGIQLDGLDPVTDNYFVMIHSDDENMHHFAKITEIPQGGEDVDGDFFEFTPKLGGQINKGTKFMLFKGTNLSTTVAISGGVKQALRNDLVVSRPLFFFFDGLDKTNQLDHNTKYFAAVSTASSGSSVTLNTYKTTFLTEQDFSNKIVDYSQYSMHVVLEDKNRENDTASTPLAQETHTLPTLDYTDYEDAFYNARRETSDSSTISTLRGPTRYLHYDFSPDHCNLMQGVFQTEMEDSVQSRSGFAESVAIDNKRIYSKKIQEDEPYRIRHMVHRASADDWFELKAEVSNFISASRRFVFTSDYDIDDLISTHDEVKIGDRILIVTGTGSTSIDVSSLSRLETESEFTSTFTNFSSLTGKLYRRAYSQSKGTLLTTFPIISGRDENLYVRFMSKNFEFIYATVSGSNENHQTLTLSFTGDSYNGTPLKYISGQYSIFIQRFDGVVESFESYKENGQTMASVKGRNNFRKLLSPIVNSNKLFSNDIIYSTKSFYNKMTDTSIDVDTTNSIVGNSKTFNHGSGTFAFAAGDKIFVKYANNVIAFVGVVSSYSSPTITLEDYPKALTEGGSSIRIMISRDRKYVLNKALSGNSNITRSVTTLSGAAGKGIYFEGGTQLNADGTDGTLLIGSSSDANENALGYPIFEPDEILSDLEFQTKLKGLGSSATEETFDTVNTLMDFEIIDIRNEETFSIIEMAPYIPLTLGRVDFQHSNVTDSVFVNRGTTSAATNSNQFTMSALSNIALEYGEALFVDGVFIGMFVSMVHNGTTYTFTIDRKATFSAGELQLLDRNATYENRNNFVHGLTLTNGAHLHGGKVISLLHPVTIDSATGNHLTTHNAPVFFNTTNHMGNYSAKHGSPYFRIFNLEFGNFERFKPRVTTFSDDYDLDYYSDEPSNLNYYAESYKINPGFTTSIPATIGTHLTGSHAQNKQHAFETKGVQPASNSRFFDTKFHKSGGSRDVVFQPSSTVGSESPYKTKDIFEQFDTKASRMFIFGNSDLEPYSGSRKDNIIGKDLTNYSLLLKRPTRTTDYTSDSELNISDTKAVTNLDSDYLSVPILENTTIPTNVHFGLMRLTEVVYDWHFNQIDPENLPSVKRTIPKTTVKLHDFIDSGDDASSISGTTITLASTTSGTIADGDDVCDNEGNYIGTVSGTPSGTTVTLAATAFKPPDSITYYTGRLHVVQNKVDNTFSGHGPKNTVIFDDAIHMLKSFVFRDGNGKYGDTGNSQFETSYGVTLDDLIRVDSGTHKTYTKHDFHAILLPLNFGSNLTQYSSSPVKHYTSSSKILEYLKLIYLGDGMSSTDLFNVLDFNLIPIALEKFDIEEGTSKLTKGLCLPPIHHLARHLDSASKKLNAVAVGYDSDSNKNKGYFGYTDKGVTTNSDTDADGTYLGFKPRLLVDTAQSTLTETELTNKTGNRSFWKYTFEVTVGSSLSTTPANRRNYFLKFINSLEGCYLVSEVANYALEEHSGQGGQKQTNSTNFGGGTNAGPNNFDDHPSSLNDSIPDTISYVVSHEVDTTESTLKHQIIVDKQLPTGFYRIMQPNHTCAYSFTPPIEMNVMSSRYTKVNGEEKTYSGIKGFNLETGGEDRRISGSTATFSSSDSAHNTGGAEAAMSMYVAVDLNKKSSSEDYVVYRSISNLSDLLPNGSRPIYMSDGQNNKRTQVTIEDRYINSNTTTKKLIFSERTNLLGIASITEPFEIVVPKDVTGDYTRGMIGAGVVIANETKNIINDLFEDNGIQFTLPPITSSDYSHYLAPNFQGIDLFSAINYLLTKKGYSLIDDNGTFKVQEGNDSSLYSGVILSDTGEYQIYDIKREQSTFDRYNEVVVYGRQHKAVRKDLRSIQKSGRKTLEVFQRELASQSDVDKRATEMFILHNRLNERIEIEIGHKGISQIRPGDIIQVEIRRENIPRSIFKVIQVKHKLTGNLVLQLGKYSKNLEDQFSELLLDSQRTNTAIRENAFSENVVNHDFLETLKVKPLRLLVRKRASAGAALGFGITLGFGSTFTGLGTITETDLVDVEY
jgi:hypothetical protein